MNKKLISIMLAMLLMLVPAAIVQAEETIKVNVSSKLYEFTVVVDTSIAEGDFTLKIVPSAGGTPIYLDEASFADATPDANGLYHYTFDKFYLRTSTTKGKYKAIVNGMNGKSGDVEFQFAERADKITLYNRMVNAKVAEEAPTDDTWFEVLNDGNTNGAVDFPLGSYLTLPSNLRLEIDACLDALQLTTIEVAGKTDAEIDNQVKAFEGIFKPEMSRLLKVVELVTAPDANAFATAVAAYYGDSDLALDLKYYDDGLVSDETDANVKRQDPEKVQAKLALITHSFAKEEVTKAFDLASLLAVIESSGEEVVTKALDYYHGKGSISLTSLATGLTSGEKNSVSIKLQNANAAEPFTSKEKLAEAYEIAVREVIEERPSDTPGGDFSEETTQPGPGVTITGGPGGGGAVTPEKPTEPTTKTFSDLGEASWAKEAIEALATKGVLSGKGDGKFYPNDTVTREEFVKIIVEAIDIHETGADATFSDVATARWSYSYIASAYRAGIIQGTSGSEFSPSGQMSRQDMAVVMKRVADLLGIRLKVNNTTFSDDASIAGYAKDAVKALSGSGIINGVGENKFSPRTTVTRAQAAKIVYELLAYGGMN